MEPVAQVQAAPSEARPVQKEILPAAVLSQFEDRAVTIAGGAKQGEVYHYRLLKPAQIEPGKKYPVVLFLHGAGERGSDNIKQLLYLPQWLAEADNRAKFPCFLVAPQCPTGQKWADVDWSSAQPQAAPPLNDAMRNAVAALDDCVQNFPVDEDRVYLTGLSMGGYGSWDLAMRRPERFAAVAPVCGGGDNTQAARIKDLPIWAWHGDQDKAVPVERSRSMIAAIEKAGGKPKYTELPGVGHSSWNQAYHGPENLLPWLFEQRRNIVR